jgi:hypothetical protein
MFPNKSILLSDGNRVTRISSLAARNVLKNRFYGTITRPEQALIIQLLVGKFLRILCYDTDSFCEHPSKTLK